jgi:membrane protease YdiL (CAAX protease family)
VRTAAAGLGLGAALYAAIAGRLPRPRRPGRTQGPPLAALIVSAAAEELLFRGAVLGALRERRPRLAVPIAAAAFAASHLPRADGRAVAAFLLIGSVLGRVSTRPRGLAVAMVAHATYDVLALLEDPG